MRRFFQALTFYLMLPWLYLASILPFSWLYRLSDICFFLAYYVLQYRRSVVWENLYNAFPNQGEAALKKLSKSFYQYLCDLLLEHIKGLTITPAQVVRRCRLQNPAVLQRLYEQGRHIILVTGHYGNWEWAGNAVALQTSYQLYALYKPLSHPYFDGLMRRIRTRFGRKLIHQSQALRTMLQYSTAPKATAILADQAPPPEHAYVMPFMNQPTYVFKGVEKLAQKFNHAVVYISTQRIKRGYYTVRAELLFDDPTVVPTHTITIAHTQQLEAAIRNQPATWLWSHRRWKHKVE